MLFLLAGVAVLLTCAMFMTRERLLGFPSAIFWMILGAHSLTLSTTPWGDVYYFLFIASALGMTIFCILAQFALREKPDREAEGTEEESLYIDEKGSEDDITRHDRGGEDLDAEAEPSKRTKALRARAEKRRTRKSRRKKINWGPFS